MKKSFLFPLMALFVLLFAACSQEEIVGGVNNQGPVTLSVNIPVNNPVTRAAPNIPDGFALRCIMQLVDANGSAIEGNRYVESVPSGSDNVTFTFEAPEGYSGAMFWADYVKMGQATDIKDVTDHLYTTTDLKKIGYNSANISTLFNNDAADAFAGYMLNSSNSITLKRPFTKLTFKTSNEMYKAYTKITVTDLPAPTGYNVMSGATAQNATGIQSGELSIAEGVWFSTFLFVGNNNPNMGEGNDIKFTLNKESGESVSLLIPGENIALTENYNVTADVTPSEQNETEVTVTFPDEMTDPSKPRPMAIGDYINKDGSFTKSYDPEQAVAIVFALAGAKTDNSNYEGKTVAGYAMALKGTYPGVGDMTASLNGAVATVDKLDVSSIKTVIVNDALYADGYGIDAWNNVSACMDGELIKTKFVAWKKVNQVSANVSDWYVPTPAMMVDMVGLLYNESGWTATFAEGIGVTTTNFPEKNTVFSAAYACGGDEYLNYTASDKNLLTSGVTDAGKYAAVQVGVTNKKLSLILPGKATNAVALRPVLTVFEASAQ